VVFGAHALEEGLVIFFGLFSRFVLVFGKVAEC
jgi:hypothetical protein